MRGGPVSTIRRIISPGLTASFRAPPGQQIGGPRENDAPINRPSGRNSKKERLIRIRDFPQPSVAAKWRHSVFPGGAEEIGPVCRLRQTGESYRVWKIRMVDVLEGKTARVLAILLLIAAILIVALVMSQTA